jgi:hypothetical protein
MARLSMLGLLLLQTMLFAVAPAPLLMLAGHEHVVIGVVTEEQWRAHQHAHMLEAMHRSQAWLSSHGTGVTNGVHIFSTGDLHSAVSALRTGAPALLPPACVCQDQNDREEILTDLQPSAIWPILDVAHPPPRGAAI